MIIIVMTEGWSCFKQKVGLCDLLTSLPTRNMTIGICFSIIQARQLKATGAQGTCMHTGLLAFQLGRPPGDQLLLQNSMDLPF